MFRTDITILVLSNFNPVPAYLQNWNGLNENGFVNLKQSVIPITFRMKFIKLQNANHRQRHKCRLSLSISLPKIVYHELVNLWIKIYLIIYTTFTHSKNIFFSIVSTPHYKKGHELKQAFTMLNHKYQMFFSKF